MTPDQANAGAMVRAILDAVHDAANPEDMDPKVFAEAMTLLRTYASHQRTGIENAAIRSIVAILESVRERSQ